MGAGIILAMMLWLNGQQDLHHYLPPKHDTCCMYRGCRKHQHFSGRWCGLPWENEPEATEATP
jgi:hypothetical protein